MSLSAAQIEEFKEYLETILDLYTEEEYVDFVEDIVYHYCARKFNIEREEAVKTFYEFVEENKNK
tara:strand:+ start:329 stop:523 length:195 start_codon:yes stop_codon:yes gene_type:complete